MSATTLSGMFQKVTLGTTSQILGAGNYTISGMTRKTVDVSEFGTDVDIFEFASADGGTISLTDVAYDPTDTQQETLRDAVKNGTKLNGSTTSGLLLWVNSTSYMHVDTNGHILMTKAGEVRADRNGIARTSFEGQVSGAFMVLV